MAARRTSLGIVTGSMFLCVALVAPACAETKDSDATFSDRVAKAGRILIGIPEKDTDAHDEQFLVEINSVLRGTGTIGKLARISNSGDKERHPRYKAGKQYVFLLTKNAAGSGWINSGDVELPIENDKVQLLVGGKVQEEVTLAKLAKMAAAKDTGPARDTLAGKWTLVMSRQGSDISFWLVDVTKDAKGNYQARLVAASKDMDASTLKEFSISDSQAQLVFLADEMRFVFDGKLDQGRVRGSLAIGDTGVISASWLEATDADKLPKKNEPQKTAGRDEFVEAASQENEAFEPLLKFVRLFPESSLALDAYPMLISLALSQDNDRAKLKKLGDDYVQTASQWGPPLEEMALIELGVTLSRKNAPDGLALEYLTRADKQLATDAPRHWKLLIQTEIGRGLLSGGQEKEGLALLTKLHEEHPFEEQLTWMLARSAEQKKNVDGAIQLYADIAALPMMEQKVVEALSQGGKKIPQDLFPGRALARLWKEKHGDLKGLSHFIDEVYEKRLKSVAGPARAPRMAGEGNRVVLCELLTGSACPPCVGADAATIALEATYAKSEAIVLRYHQHSPAPDPLASDDSEERYTSYDAEGTPMIYVNGKLFPGAGGFMSNVPDIYRRLQKAIEPYLAEKTSLKLELSAKADNGRIAISAKASGVTTFPEDVHLRLVLAEDKVPFMADNGIRFHEMLVRAMPGGADGIEPVKGQLAYQGEVDLAKLKSQITQSLAKIEKTMAQEFESKPLDFKAFHLVAFLQNDDTGEVLQAAAIPVVGTLAAVGESPRPAAGKAARSKAPAGKAN